MDKLAVSTYKAAVMLFQRGLAEDEVLKILQGLDQPTKGYYYLTGITGVKDD